MTIVYSILMGMLQGILEFLPVSSFGHIFLIERMLYVDLDFAVVFGIFLHLGTLIPVIVMFRKDILYTLIEYPGLFWDLLTNARIYLKNRKRETKKAYIRVIQTAYRKLAVIVLITMIPTAMLAYMARHLFVIWCETPVMPAIGFLMTGIILLVVDFSNTNGKVNIRNASIDQAMWIGIGQGISIFPGISRAGLTLGMGKLCGHNTLFAIKVSYLSAIPAILGSAVYEFRKLPAMHLAGNEIGCCAAGMITAMLVGFFCIRKCFKIVKKVRFRYFAIYCFVIGIYMIQSIYIA